MRNVDRNGKDCGVWKRDGSPGWQERDPIVHAYPSDEINVSAAHSGPHPIARTFAGPLLVGVLLLAALVGGCWIATRKGAARIYPVPSSEITVSPVPVKS